MNGVKMPTARALSDRNKLSVLMMKNVNIQKHRNTDCAKNDGKYEKKRNYLTLGTSFQEVVYAGDFLSCLDMPLRAYMP